MVQFTLYPLISILQLRAAAEGALGLQGELGIILTGVIVSALIGAVYFTAPSILLLYISRRRNLPILEIFLTILAHKFINHDLRRATLSPIVMAIGSGALVLSTIALTAGALASEWPTGDNSRS